MRSWMLTRYFSALSLVLLLLAGGVLTWLVHVHQVWQMEHLAQDRNVMTTRVFQNLLIDDVEQVARLSQQMDPAHLAQRPEVAELKARLGPLLRDSDIAKVKIYTPDGLTVFSTETRQIGENKADNAGFRSALAGQVASELTHRDEFSAFDQVRSNLDLVSSYVPVYESGRLVAIFELYQEVTNLLLDIQRSRLEVMLLIGLVLLALFVFQWIVVRRAQGILVAHENQLETDKRQLGERVLERTEALQQSQDRVMHLSTHDQLTGLPNRVLLFDRLQQALLHSERTQQHGAIVLLDLDHFSALNDMAGQGQGDGLLRAVGQALADQVRDSDTVARIGSDEFAIVLDAQDTQPARALAATEALSEKLLQAVRDHYRLPDTGFLGTACAGVTLFKGAAVSAQELVQQAELAMHRSKAAGRDRLTFFDPAMAEQVLHRAQMEADLHQALRHGEFELYFQAQVEADSRRVCGAEALLRWWHPQRGLIPPAAFIPLAEETGLIVPIGLWVLEAACRQLQRWGQHPDRAHLVLAVNVSVQQFRQPDFAVQVVALLERTGADPTRLKLELTESLFADDLDSIVDTMNQLRAMGVGFSLDDFGTGYSCLSYLSRLPLDQLKIDKAFVHGIGRTENEVPLCAAIINLAHALRLKVVAEGVETEVQRYFLAHMHHCDWLQGYLIGKPVPLADFEAALNAGPAALARPA